MDFIYFFYKAKQLDERGAAGLTSYFLAMRNSIEERGKRERWL